VALFALNDMERITLNKSTLALMQERLPRTVLRREALYRHHPDVKILGIDDKTGSIEVGKDANIIGSQGETLLHGAEIN
jgi:cytosine/adenosine deaminase-related metal-dependent hydrolase